MNRGCISLGAGVQSTTLLLMAVAGEFDRCPEVAIFADTGWEPRAVYRHLEWLEAEVAGRVEVVRVSAGNLRDDLVGFAEGAVKRYASPPVFIHGEKGSGMLRRQCTREYKIEPIERELRRRGFGGRGSKAVRCEQWLGISFDEVQRMNASRTPWIDSRWPLIERRMTRADCLAWFSKRYPGQPLAKSACIGCPYHSDATWREVRADQEAWADAIEVDLRIRSLPGLEGEAFLHRRRVPLGEVDLSTPEERGQQVLAFDADCDGMCGV